MTDPPQSHTRASLATFQGAGLHLAPLGFYSCLESLTVSQGQQSFFKKGRELNVSLNPRSSQLFAILKSDVSEDIVIGNGDTTGPARQTILTSDLPSQTLYEEMNRAVPFLFDQLNRLNRSVASSAGK